MTDPQEQGSAFAADPERLHAACDPSSLGFETTASVAPLEGVLGQDEAMDALAFGIEMDSPGFNGGTTPLPRRARSPGPRTGGPALRVVLWR